MAFISISYSRKNGNVQKNGLGRERDKEPGGFGKFGERRKI